MKFGLTDSQYKYIYETVVAPIANKGARIWCFGSRARGDHKPYSDLDLAIESHSDLHSLISLIRSN